MIALTFGHGGQYIPAAVEGAEDSELRVLALTLSGEPGGALAQATVSAYDATQGWAPIGTVGEVLGAARARGEPVVFDIGGLRFHPWFQEIPSRCGLVRTLHGKRGTLNLIAALHQRGVVVAPCRALVPLVVRIIAGRRIQETLLAIPSQRLPEPTRQAPPRNGPWRFFMVQGMRYPHKRKWRPLRMPTKGHCPLVVMDALARALPTEDFEFHFVGSDPSRPILETKAAELNARLGRRRLFIHPATARAPYEMMRESHLCFGAGYAAREAIAIGRPLIPIGRIGIGPVVRTATLERLDALNYGDYGPLGLPMRLAPLAAPYLARQIRSATRAYEEITDESLQLADAIRKLLPPRRLAERLTEVYTISLHLG